MRYCEIKRKAKELFFQNYGMLVGMLFLESLLVGIAAGLPQVGGVATFFLPFAVGISYVMLRLVQGEKSSVSDMFAGTFNKNYLRNVGGLAWMSLWVALWSFLFVIPGIVKSYSYAATPYLLAKYPSLGAREALEKSKELMNSKKSRLFGLHLSFFWWYLILFLIIVPTIIAMSASTAIFFSSVSAEILPTVFLFLSPILLALGSLISCLYIFLFLTPYTTMADAVFMDELFREGEEKGILTPEEVPLSEEEYVVVEETPLPTERDEIIPEEPVSEQ